MRCQVLLENVLGVPMTHSPVKILRKVALVAQYLHAKLFTLIYSGVSIGRASRDFFSLVL